MNKIHIVDWWFMGKEKLTQADCLFLLREKQAMLKDQGENRYPKRSDFSEAEVMAIKSFLGPWPRALETAGIKPPRPGGRNPEAQRDGDP